MSRLFYIIGASGAGKDTLMGYAKNQMNGTEKVIFAHRYITREPHAGSENHVHLTENEFDQRKNAGLFALDWASHGLFYGIGSEINNWLGAGFNVVINGSREYLPVALKLYPQIIVILITASTETISKRLIDRGRESQADIEKRINRSAQITADITDLIKIENNGAIKDAGDLLIDLICSK